MAIREQERAKFALERVNEAKTLNIRDKYKTQLIKLPARLQMNGLGQTVAFYLSEGTGSPEVKICEWLQDWLRPDHSRIYPANKSLIEAITQGTPDEYRRASAEVRALVVWLKRFAEAFIEDIAEARR